MKKKNRMSVIRIFVTICITFLVLSVFSTVLATEGGTSNFNPAEFNSGGVSSKVTDVVENTSGTIVAALRIISVAVAIVIILVIAMKYMMSSAGDRADIKKHAVAYITGTFILFAAAQIIATLIEVADKLFPTK